MSNNWFRRNSCEAKKCYNTFKDAENAARYVMRRQNLRDEFTRLKPYRCLFCKSWHLTSEWHQEVEDGRG